MPNFKHIGRIKTNKRRAIVAYRTIPKDPYHALVILTESLPADEHDTLIKLVESPAGQEAYELAEAMARAYLPDGRNMLAGFHSTGQLKKVSTKDIEMTPDTRTVIDLDKLNEIIATQRGVALEDLCVKPTANSSPQSLRNTTAMEPISQEEKFIAVESPLTDEQLATKYRSDATKLYNEAKRLREMAEELSPSKKPTGKKTKGG